MIAFVIAFIGAAIAMLLGILIFSGVTSSIDCEVLTPGLQIECNNAKDVAWTVVVILPIVFFFVIFSIFGDYRIDPMFDWFQRRSKLIKGNFYAGSNNKVKKLTIPQKLMIMIGLARVKKDEVI